MSVQNGDVGPPRGEASGAFEDMPMPGVGGIPWYGAILVVVLLGLVASIIDWVLGTGIGVATGAAFVLGCLVLGGRVRRTQIAVGFVAAPLCFAIIVTISGIVQLHGHDEFGAAFRIFWTYALITDGMWLIIGTLVSVLLAAVRLFLNPR